MQGFLEGIRVVELAQYIPGPLAARHLADFGADVIKVEPPQGDPLLQLAGDGPATDYISVNGGKRVLRVDLKSEDGRDTVRRLAESADVLIESFRPGVAERLGLGAAALHAVNPGLVYCSLSGWGQTGPYRHRPGHDINYMALGGGLLESGPADRPAFAYPPTADYASALQAALTIAAALLGRQKRGVGAVLDISIFESVLAWQALSLNHAGKPSVKRGNGLLNGGFAGYNLYETQDGRWLSLGIVGEPKFWTVLCERIERMDLVARLSDPLPQTALTEELRAVFAARPLREWILRFEGADTCFEPLWTLPEMAGHPHIAARGLVGRMEPSGAVEIRYPAHADGKAPSGRREPVILAGNACGWS